MEDSKKKLTTDELFTTTDVELNVLSAVVFPTKVTGLYDVVDETSSASSDRTADWVAKDEAKTLPTDESLATAVIVQTGGCGVIAPSTALARKYDVDRSVAILCKTPENLIESTVGPVYVPVLPPPMEPQVALTDCKELDEVTGPKLRHEPPGAFTVVDKACILARALLLAANGIQPNEAMDPVPPEAVMVLLHDAMDGENTSVLRLVVVYEKVEVGPYAARPRAATALAVPPDDASTPAFNAVSDKADAHVAKH